ncbi:MAG: GGDEF domain-containing protein [Oscillospiraceae bacterium]|nr:GGDEF domain-containing protein [Oscillospiraceae bacterium]
MEQNGITLSSCELLDKISDVTRIVDPLQKKVIQNKASPEIMEEVHCFDFWGKNKACDNCISIRAYHDNTTYVKIEYKKDKTYMITAVPYFCADRRIVIEMIKDITKSILFDFSENAAAEQAGVCAIVDHMNKLAFSDFLTDLYNRRYIMERLPVDILNSALLSADLSIIMVDIDFFKKVNDIYGHIAGDLTLKNVAKVLSGCIKNENDWIARFGGEEFMISLAGANLEMAQKTAECMRKSIEDATVQFEGNDIRVTVSIGIYSLKSKGNEDADDLLKHADEKMYLAKKNGRNRIEY